MGEGRSGAQEEEMVETEHAEESEATLPSPPPPCGEERGRLEEEHEQRQQQPAAPSTPWSPPSLQESPAGLWSDYEIGLLGWALQGAQWRRETEAGERVGEEEVWCWSGVRLLRGAWGAARALAQALSASRASTREREHHRQQQEHLLGKARMMLFSI